MALKPDEALVRDLLIDHFGPGTTAEEIKNDPPDIYLIVGTERIAVEISRLAPISVDENGEIQNRTTQDCFGLRLIADLDNKLKDKIPSNLKLFLTLYVPVENPAQYKRELHSYLNEVIENGLTAGDKWARKISGSKVRLSIYPRHPHDDVAIFGAVPNSDSRACISQDAKIILHERIMDKAGKCRKVTHKPLWLALLNDYWLADEDTYIQAYQTIQDSTETHIEHEFDKILFVSQSHSVSQIFSK